MRHTPHTWPIREEAIEEERDAAAGALASPLVLPNAAALGKGVRMQVEWMPAASPAQQDVS